MLHSLSAFLSPQSFPDTAKKLAPGTKVVDVEMLDSKNNLLNIKDLTLEEEVEISIPKTLGKDGNNTLPRRLKKERGQGDAQRNSPLFLLVLCSSVGKQLCSSSLSCVDCSFLFAF